MSHRVDISRDYQSNNVADWQMEQPNAIFVFGSNTRGLHGRGAARLAKLKYGAEQYKGRGVQGKCYAIATKCGAPLVPQTLRSIDYEVKQFLKFAEQNSDKRFYVTRVGCGLAGYEDYQIAPMFVGATPNVLFDPMWKAWGFPSWGDEVKPTVCTGETST